jgi:DNA-damage-inducible protein D
MNEFVKELVETGQAKRGTKTGDAMIARYKADQKGETMNQQEAELIPAGDLRLILFKGRGIRQVFHNDEWFFSVIDVISVLSGSGRPRRYWNDLKTKLVDRKELSSCPQISYS